MARRTTEERKRDTLRAIGDQSNAWVASGSADGAGYMIPLTYIWDGKRFTFATLGKSRTGRDLRRARVTRLSLPSPEDVVIVDGSVEFFPINTPEPFAAAFGEQIGWDPRKDGDGYVWFQVTPIRVQAWRDVDEITGREIMRDGVWLA